MIDRLRSLSIWPFSLLGGIGVCTFCFGIRFAATFDLWVWRIDEVTPGELVMLTAVEASREVSDKTIDSSNDVFAGKPESVVFVTALPGLSKK